MFPLPLLAAVKTNKASPQFFINFLIKSQEIKMKINFPLSGFGMSVSAHVTHMLVLCFIGGLFLYMRKHLFVSQRHRKRHEKLYVILIKKTPLFIHRPFFLIYLQAALKLNSFSFFLSLKIKVKLIKSCVIKVVAECCVNVLINKKKTANTTCFKTQQN